MGATVDKFKETHKAALGLLGQIDSSKGQERVEGLNSLKDALLAHIEEEDVTIKEAIGKVEADVSFKLAGQSFMDELGSVTHTALLPFFEKYSSAGKVDGNDFKYDFGGIKNILKDRISYEEGKFYPELEKLGY